MLNEVDDNNQVDSPPFIIAKGRFNTTITFESIVSRKEDTLRFDVSVNVRTRNSQS